MNRKFSASTRSLLRIFAWAFLLGSFYHAFASLAFAQEVGVAVNGDKPNFFLQVLQNLFNSGELMKILGQPEVAIPAFIALNVIVFVETGLLIGFCLPGDSLLVMAGLIAANPACGWNLPLLLVTLSLSAILGDSVGYSIGYQAGPKIFTREDSFFFRKDHLLKAKEFYERHGGKTIILARFLPLFRTFAPVVAGVGRMDYRRFLMFNVVGGVGWVFSMILTGYFLPSLLNPLLQPIFGSAFHVEDHVEKVVVLIVFVTLLPALAVWLRHRFANHSSPLAVSRQAPSPVD